MASSASSSNPSSDPSPLSFLLPEIRLALYHAPMKLTLSRMNAELEGTTRTFQQRSVVYEQTLITERSHGSSAITASSSSSLPPLPSGFLPETYLAFTENSPTFRCRFLPGLHMPNIGVTRSVSPNWGFQAQHNPPPPLSNDFVIDMQRFQPFQAESRARGGVSLGKTFLGLTFQAALGLMVFYYQILSSPPPPPSPSSSPAIGSLPPPLSLHILEAAITVGFAGSLIGILLRNAYPVPADIIEKTGSISAALGFFVMACMLLPGTSTSIGWLGGVGCVLSFASSSSPSDHSLLSFLPPVIRSALYRAQMKLTLSRMDAELELTRNFQQHSTSVVVYEQALIVNDSHGSSTVSTLFYTPPTIVSPAHSSSDSYDPHSAFIAISPPFSSLYPPANSPHHLSQNSASFHSGFLTRLQVPNIGVARSVSPYWGPRSQQNPPTLLSNDFDIEQGFQQFPQTLGPADRGVSLAKTFLGLTFQAALALMVFYYQSLSPPPSPSSSHDIKSFPHPLALHIVEAAMAIGFAGSLIGIFLRNACPVPADIIEKTGSLSAALGFFVIIWMMLPGIFTCIGWFGGIGSLLAFWVAVKKMKLT
ncbi:hypothetical protein F0562_008110 [Nyssa sinensis]|uniref:Uncharacterized protein n=1 Tax=Nyssa sinensis TaxID=561372 RepID=A0A5J5AB52_9ASTE|nr:hypothetical protein F0562_008110 [Nyssa sinensis]